MTYIYIIIPIVIIALIIYLINKNKKNLDQDCKAPKSLIIN